MKVSGVESRAGNKNHRLTQSASFLGFQRQAGESPRLSHVPPARVVQFSVGAAQNAVATTQRQTTGLPAPQTVETGDGGEGPELQDDFVFSQRRPERTPGGTRSRRESGSRHPAGRVQDGRARGRSPCGARASRPGPIPEEPAGRRRAQGGRADAPPRPVRHD